MPSHAAAWVSLALFLLCACGRAQIPDLCGASKPDSPCNSLCGDGTQSVIRYRKQDNFPICLEISTGSIEGRSVQYPKTDEFSLLTLDSTGTIPAGFDPFNDGTAGTLKAYTTGVQQDDKGAHNMLVTEDVSLAYFDTDSSRKVVVPFYQLVVHMDVGRPVKIEWEYGDCSGCSSKDCMFSEICGVAIENCDALCRPQVYVAFSGTDSSGQIMTSSGSLLTRFSAFGLSSIYSDVRNGF